VGIRVLFLDLILQFDDHVVRVFATFARSSFRFSISMALGFTRLSGSKAAGALGSRPSGYGWGFDYSSVVLQPAEKWFHGQEKGCANKGRKHATSCFRHGKPPKIESWGRFGPTNRHIRSEAGLGLGLASFFQLSQAPPRMEWSETSRRAIRPVGIGGVPSCVRDADWVQCLGTASKEDEE